MKICGFIETSFVDWDGLIASVLFLPGCQFRCPFCHNADLVLNPTKFEEIPFSKVKSFLKLHKGWIDGVCITGGEPTLHSDLPELCKKLKDLGVKVKLDTNGTNFEMLKKLVSDKLVDFVAMDIKSSFDEKNYFRASGIENKELLRNVKNSVNLLLSNIVDYEFRTTVVPGIHKKENISNITKHISTCKKYVIQNFRPGKCLDETFNTMDVFTDKDLRQFKYAAQENLSKVVVRK